MRLLLTYLFLAFTLCSSAQKIRFTDSTNTWVTYWNNADCGYIAHYYYSGDSSYHGYYYRNLFRVSTRIWSVEPCSTYMIQSMYIREDTVANMVFCRNLGTGDTTERVLYDYNLNVGDSIHYGGSGVLPVVSDSVT